MNDELESLFQQVTVASQVEQVTQRILELLQDPNCFEALFSIISSPRTEKSIQSSLVHLNMALKGQKSTLTSELVNFIKERLQIIAFSQYPQDILNLISLVVETLIQIITLDNWPEILQISFSAISTPELIPNSLTLIPCIMTYMQDEQIIQNSEQILNIVDSALTTDSWPIRSSGFLILHKLCKASKINVTQHILPIQNYEHNSFLFNNKQTKKYIIEIWTTFFYLVSNNFVDKEFILHISPIIVEISSDESIEAMNRLVVLQSISPVLSEMDEQKIDQIFDLVFSLGVKILMSDGVFEQMALFIFESALKTLDPTNSYALVRQKIEAAFASSDAFAQAFGIYILSEVITVAPEIASSDFQFLSETMASALDSGNELLCESVCIFINSSVDAFSSAAALCCNLIKKVVPFIVSPNDSLRTAAYDSIHSLCDVIDGGISNFFEIVFPLNEQIPIENISNYNTILAEAINKDEDVGDEEIDASLEYVTKFFGDEVDVDDSSSVLLVVGSIIKKDDSQAEELLNPSVELSMRSLVEGNMQTKVDVLDFVYEVFPRFSDVFKENYGELIEIIFKIAKKIIPGSEDFEINGEDTENITTDTLIVSAIRTGCLIAKTLHDNQIAEDLSNCIVHVLSNDVTNYIEDISESIVFIANYINEQFSGEIFGLLTNLINTTENDETIIGIIPAYENLIKYSSDNNRNSFLEAAFGFLQKFFVGELPCLGGNIPLTNYINSKMISQIGFLIGDVVKFQIGEANEQLCNYMLDVLKSDVKLAAFSFVGSFSDAIEAGTCPENCLQQLLEILPAIIENADDPDMMHNTCFLLNVIAAKHSQIVPSIVGLSNQIWSWFVKALEDKDGWGLFLSNVASLFLTLALHDQTIPAEIVNASLRQFPPVDVDETENMANTIIKLVNSNRIPSECMESLIFCVASFVILPQDELEDRKVSKYVIDTLHGIFMRLMANEDSRSLLAAAFGRQRSKLAKLQRIIEGSH